MAYNPQNPNGQATMANSSPVVIASDQSTLVITGSANVTGSVIANAGTGNFTVVQSTAASLNATVAQSTAANLNATVVQGTAANLNATVVGSGNFTVVQPTAANLNATVSQGTAANLNATVVQGTAANLNATVVGTGTFAVQADTELPAAAALADAAANFTAPAVGGAALTYNGVTWDRQRSTDALSGSAANDTVPGILSVGTGPGFSVRYNPTNIGTATNSSSSINVDGANTMVWGISTTTTGTFIFEATADGTNWYSIEAYDANTGLWVSGLSLTPTLGKVYYVPCSGLRTIRLRVNATLGATVSHFVTLTNGGQIISTIDSGAAPHNFGYTLVHKDAVYATTQTSTSIWAPSTATRKFAITDITVTTGGTTAGVVTIYDAASATAYSAGVTPAIFRGEFAPSTTARPGVVKSFNVPYVSTTANNNVLVTTSAAINPLYVQINGYEI